MQVEHHVTIQATPAVVFRFYEDVANWHTWDPDTRQATLDGPLQVGVTGRLVPTKGNAVPMVVTELIAGRSLTVESRIPLFRMVFEHLLEPVPEGTRALHRATFSGLLSIVLGPLLSRQLNAGLPVTLGHLKQKAEALAGGSATQGPDVLSG